MSHYSQRRQPNSWDSALVLTALHHQDVTQLFFQAIEAGVTHLDGAQMYKNEDTLTYVDLFLIRYPTPHQKES